MPIRVIKSSGIELSAAFSLDGKYLAVGKKHCDISYFNFVIVPNDGMVYDITTRQLS